MHAISVAVVLRRARLIALAAWCAGRMLSAYGAANVLSTQAPACPEEVRIVYPDIDATPFINGHGEDIPQNPGMLIDWAKTALAKSTCHVRPVFIRRPSLRALLEIDHGHYDILLAAATDNPYVNQLRFPMDGDRIAADKVIVRGALMLYTLPSSTAAWDGVKLDLPVPGTVGVTRGQVAEFVATRKGWQVDASQDVETNFRKLSLGRVSAVLEQQLIASDFIKSLPAGQVRVLSVPVQTMNYYSPVATGFYQRYPQFTEQFWLDLCDESRKALKDLPKCPAR